MYLSSAAILERIISDYAYNIEHFFDCFTLFLKNTIEYRAKKSKNRFCFLNCAYNTGHFFDIFAR